MVDRRGFTGRNLSAETEVAVAATRLRTRHRDGV
jgi:hypothetical protein